MFRQQFLTILLGVAPVCVFVWEYIVILKITKSPRICIRYSPIMQHRVQSVSRMRHISQAQVIRDALNQYFKSPTKLENIGNSIP